MVIMIILMIIPVLTVIMDNDTNQDISILYLNLLIHHPYVLVDEFTTKYFSHVSLKKISLYYFFHHWNLFKFNSPILTLYI